VPQKTLVGEGSADLRHIHSLANVRNDALYCLPEDLDIGMWFRV
jgi:hypothetical protein